MDSLSGCSIHGSPGVSPSANYTGLAPCCGLFSAIERDGRALVPPSWPLQLRGSETHRVARLGCRGHRKRQRMRQTTENTLLLQGRTAILMPVASSPVVAAPPAPASAPGGSGKGTVQPPWAPDGQWRNEDSQANVSATPTPQNKDPQDRWERKEKMRIRGRAAEGGNHE